MDKWLEVDLKKLKHNLTELKKIIKVPIMAVVKHNGYGLGAVVMARFLELSGIRNFSVATLDEGVELRKGGIWSPVVIYNPFFQDEEDLIKMLKYRLTPAVYSIDLAQKLNDFAVHRKVALDVHVKIDTGMGRMGFSPNELLAYGGKLKEMQGLNFAAAFTHYSNAFEKDMKWTKVQLETFEKLIKKLNGLGLSIPLKYSANSHAALKFPETHMDMVNIGSAFLGGLAINPAISLAKIYSCKARVLQVKNLTRGSTVGYSNTYRVKHDTRAAVVAIGYADGFGVQKKIDNFRITDFLRAQYQLLKTFLKPEKHIFFQETPLRVIGKVGMQLTVVDIGELPVQPGDILDVSVSPQLTNGYLKKKYTGGNLFIAQKTETIKGKSIEPSNNAAV